MRIPEIFINEAEIRDVVKIQFFQHIVADQLGHHIIGRDNHIVIRPADGQLGIQFLIGGKGRVVDMDSCPAGKFLIHIQGSIASVGNIFSPIVNVNRYPRTGRRFFLSLRPLCGDHGDNNDAAGSKQQGKDFFQAFATPFRLAFCLF